MNKKKKSIKLSLVEGVLFGLVLVFQFKNDYSLKAYTFRFNRKKTAL